MTPQLVQVVRPKMNWARSIAAIGAHFLRGWLVMLIVGALLPRLGLGYWQAILAVLGLRMIFISDYGYWTVGWPEAFPKKRKKVQG